jgi:hypothetical protein
LFPWPDKAKLAAPRFQVHVLVQDVVPVHDVVPAYGEFRALAAGSLKAFTVSFEPAIDALKQRALTDLDLGPWFASLVLILHCLQPIKNALADKAIRQVYFVLIFWCHVYSVSGMFLGFQRFRLTSAYVLETSSTKVLTNPVFLVKHQMLYSQTLCFEHVGGNFLL